MKGVRSENSAAYIVSEYFQRRMMAECGNNQQSLDVFKSECFVIIKSVITKMQAEEQKKLGRRHGRR